MPDDGSMPRCGKPDRRGSTIIPPLRPLGRGKAEEVRLALVREKQSVSLCQTSAAEMLSTGTWGEVDPRHMGRKTPPIHSNMGHDKPVGRDHGSKTERPSCVSVSACWGKPDPCPPEAVTGGDPTAAHAAPAQGWHSP